MGHWMGRRRRRNRILIRSKSSGRREEQRKEEQYFYHRGLLVYSICWLAGFLVFLRQEFKIKVSEEFSRTPQQTEALLYFLVEDLSERDERNKTTISETHLEPVDANIIIL